MTEPADDPIDPRTVPKPTGVLSPMIGETYCLRCKRPGLFMCSNGVCDDCDHEDRVEKAWELEEQYREDMKDAGRGHLLR